MNRSSCIRDLHDAGYSRKEIREILGCSPGLIRAALHALRRPDRTSNSLTYGLGREITPWRRDAHGNLCREVRGI